MARRYQGERERERESARAGRARSLWTKYDQKYGASSTANCIPRQTLSFTYVCCKKHKSQIHNPDCAAYKKMQNMKKQVAELQHKHAKEKERYLDRAICNSYEQNDTRKLTELVKSYQDGSFKSLDTRISCVKDEYNIVRTDTHSILRAFRNRWFRVFCHDKRYPRLE